MKTMNEKGNFGVAVSIGLMFAGSNTLASIENASTTEEKIEALISLCALVKANPDFIEITDKKELEQLKILGQKAYEFGKAQIDTANRSKSNLEKKEKKACTK